MISSISAALEAVEEKKENLRKAFSEVEARSSCLTCFTLQWKDIEEELNSMKRSLQVRLKHLEASNQPTESDCYLEMKWFCVKMDGVGLGSYLLLKSTSTSTSTSLKEDEVGAALASASDAGQLVLDALAAQSHHTRVCILLLQQLTTISPHITPQIKTKAQSLALDWKAKAAQTLDPDQVLAFLQLITTYHCVSLFHQDQNLVDFAVSIASHNHALHFIQSLDINHKIPDIIRKLISTGNKLDAFKFVYAFDLVHQFPPVPLLRDYLKQSIKATHEIRKNGNHSPHSLNVADDEQLSALRLVIKCIEERNLESEYPRGTLDERVEELVRRKADRKRPAIIPPLNKEPHSTNKRPRPTATGTLTSNTPPIPQSLVQPMSSSIVRLPPPYMSSPAQYGFAGTNPGVPYYITDAAGRYPGTSYGLGANPVSYGVNLGPSGSHLYSDPHVPDGFYDWPMNFGGNGMPPSHYSPFYPY